MDRPKLGRAVVREAGKHGRGGGEGEAQSGVPTVTQSIIRVLYVTVEAAESRLTHGT